MNWTQLYFAIISGRCRGLPSSMARIILSILSLPYAICAAVRNLQYDLRLKNSYRASIPVISIGNVTTGGTGKTPMVEYVASYYRERGLRVAILSRGYGKKSNEGMNDEGLLLDQNLPDVPHLQGSNRVELAEIASEELESEILILDDGHQHRQLQRDLNMVLIDATNPFGYGWVLPRGLLREPLGNALKRAGLIVITRTNLVTDQDKQKITEKIRQRIPPEISVVESIHCPQDLLMADGSRAVLNSIQGKKAAIFSGLGNPEAFRMTVQELGLEICAEREYPDHHDYSESDLAELSAWVANSGADLALTSQKDLVKLPVDHLGGKPLAAIRIGLVITAGENQLKDLLDNLL